MGEILCLLNQYHISDPACIEEGVFNNQAIQVLYNQLIEQGNISLTEALKVGATIEDVDIRDLMESRAKTSNPAIIDVFDRLTCGSKNHMRSFVSNLNKNGGAYTPQFIYITRTL